MFEQDYIMRQMYQIIQALMKTVFKIDSPSPSTELIKDMETRKIADDMLKDIDNGKIAEAEEILFSLIQNRTLDNLLTGIVFYSYLNEKDDVYLEMNHYSRVNAKNSIKRLLSEYGLKYMENLFFIINFYLSGWFIYQPDYSFIAIFVC